MKLFKTYQHNKDEECQPNIFLSIGSERVNTRFGWFKTPGIKKIIRHVVLLPIDRKRTDRYKIGPIEQ